MASGFEIEALRRIPMIAELLPWQFDAVAESAERVFARKGSVILERGSDDGYTYFLVQGEVTLEAADGFAKTIEANSDTIRVPLANLRPRILGVTAETQVNGIRVPDIVLSAAGCDGSSSSGITVDSQDDEVSKVRAEAESKLSLQLYRDLVADKAVLPSLPDLALRIRKAIEDDISDAKAIARLVESDPAMAAKLLKAANSALYGGMNAVESCPAAIVRLGMQTTKQLVLSFALSDIFKNKDPKIQNRMHVLWKHSSQIAAICFVLARELEGMDPEEALLIGLVHDVGAIAVLNYLEQYPELADDEQGLDDTLERMRGDLGAIILRKWKFPPEVVAGARDAEHWLRQHDGPPDFTDLLVVAQVHERLRKHQLAGLPPLPKISAFKRVLGDASPEKSLEILHAAKAQIDEMRSVLRG